MMKDYWNELKLNECWSKREQYNVLLNYLDERLENKTIEDTVSVSSVSISFKVTDVDTDDFVSNTHITLKSENDDDVVFSATTGKAGGCKITNIPLGDYDLTASANNYILFEDSIVVDEELSQYNIKLIPLVTE